MARVAKQRSELGQLTKLGQGGQGAVYRAPQAEAHFAHAFVYKEYNQQTRAHIDFTALGAMPDLVEQSMLPEDGERLISMAAWPCDLVEDDGEPTGFLMPEIPRQFTVSLETMRGRSDSLGEFQHLLNGQSVLDDRGIAIDDIQRYSLLREVASGMAFLHSHGVCVGDVSPRNLLFSLEKPEAVYFVDCDAMRINGMSASPQVETPEWGAPEGEDTGTVYSDAYKLGLLALRLLAGSQTTKDPQNLPSDTPVGLRKLITDTLDHPPQKRPLPETWTYILSNAIEETQHRKKVKSSGTASTDPSSEIIADEAFPGEAIPSDFLSGADPSTAPTAAPWDSTGKLVGVIVAAAVVGFLIWGVAVGIFSNSDSGSSSSRSSWTTPSYYRDAPTSEQERAYLPPNPPAQAALPQAAPSEVALPPLVRGPDGSSSHEDCGEGYHFTDRTGWGTRAGRGSNATSCQFVKNVFLGYWKGYGNASRESRTFPVSGSLPCSNVPGAECDGSLFIVHCGASPSANWITCVGGVNAVVYLY